MSGTWYETIHTNDSISSVISCKIMENITATENKFTADIIVYSDELLFCFIIIVRRCCFAFTPNEALSSNYIPIAVAYILSKVIERLILNNIESRLITSDN